MVRPFFKPDECQSNGAPVGEGPGGKAPGLPYLPKLQHHADGDGEDHNNHDEADSDGGQVDP